MESNVDWNWKDARLENVFILPKTAAFEDEIKDDIYVKMDICYTKQTWKSAWKKQSVDCCNILTNNWKTLDFPARQINKSTVATS